MKLIKSNKASLIAGAGLRLVPGINQVKDETWANALNTRAIQQMLKDKVLEDVTPKELQQAAPLAPKELKQAAPLADEAEGNKSALKAVGQNKAIELVKETLDLRLLEEWAALEDRVKVKSAIATQIAKIRKETKPPKKDEAEAIEDTETDETET